VIEIGFKYDRPVFLPILIIIAMSSIMILFVEKFNVVQTI